MRADERPLLAKRTVLWSVASLYPLEDLLLTNEPRSAKEARNDNPQPAIVFCTPRIILR